MSKDKPQARDFTISQWELPIPFKYSGNRSLPIAIWEKEQKFLCLTQPDTFPHRFLSENGPSIAGNFNTLRSTLIYLSLAICPSTIISKLCQFYTAQENAKLPFLLPVSHLWPKHHLPYSLQELLVCLIALSHSNPFYRASRVVISTMESHQKPSQGCPPHSPLQTSGLMADSLPPLFLPMMA